VQVSVLRRKLSGLGKDAAQITTRRGRGYRYEVPPAPVALAARSAAAG